MGRAKVWAWMWLVACLAFGAGAGAAQSGEALARAMDAVRSQDWEAAAAAVRGRDAAERAVVDWHRLRSGDGDFADYVAFLDRHGDWPGLPFLRLRGENTIPAAADPARVIAYFEGASPQTATGALRLALALRAAGDATAAEAEAVRAWRDLSLDASSESVLLAEFGPALADHHVARMDHLLWEGRLAQAERMRPRVPEGWRLLHDARAALRNDAPGVDARIAAVPADLADDPGLAWERLEWRARRGRTDDVIALLMERSVSAESLGRPEKWGSRRRVLARELMREGRDRQAYLVAAQHHLTEGNDFADLEWLSGYLALRRLDTPAAALAHFRTFRQGVSSPISLGRAGYWEGRAHEAMGQVAEAQAAYAFGAEFQVSFYGQLAAERAGLPMDPRLAGTERFPDPEGAAFLQSTVWEAGQALHAAGEVTLAARFFAHLSESLDRTETGRLLTALEPLDAPYVQLAVAKSAARDTRMMHAAYFPLVAISTDATPDVAPELALAVARRESEFNPVVVSPAGARGLMQVMPATAQEVAAQLGLDYRLSQLSDPVYNARLGTAYLDGLQRRFGDAVVLVAVGYNAGPGRANSWVAAYGDPRDANLDAVDWIENIPFTETRNYVMRVTESLAPYRARLAGAPVELDLARRIGGG